MITIEEMEGLLGEIADSLPEEFYKNLNGGIVLLPEEKKHPKTNELYILGEYHREAVLGRFITIYYGSFLKVYGNIPNEQMKEKLRATLLHEFRHHLEYLAGERDLEIEDAKMLLEHLEKVDGQ